MDNLGWERKTEKEQIVYVITVISCYEGVKLTVGVSCYQKW